MCNHPIQNLIGTADGIQCRICGAKFKSFDELNVAVNAAPAEAKKTKKAKKTKEADG